MDDEQWTGTRIEAAEVAEWRAFTFKRKLDPGDLGIVAEVLTLCEGKFPGSFVSDTPSIRLWRDRGAWGATLSFQMTMPANRNPHDVALFVEKYLGQGGER